MRRARRRAYGPRAACSARCAREADAHARAALAAAGEAVPPTSAARDRARACPARLRATIRVVAAPGHQRDRRDHPHQPRARAARRRRRSTACAPIARRLQQSRIRPGAGRAAARATSTPKRCSRRLTGAEAAVVVNNNAAATLLVLAALAAGREVAHLARRAGRDRRRLPHARRDGAVGREAARGRHHQSHARWPTTPRRSPIGRR